MFFSVFSTEIDEFPRSKIRKHATALFTQIDVSCYFLFCTKTVVSVGQNNFSDYNNRSKILLLVLKPYVVYRKKHKKETNNIMAVWGLAYIVYIDYGAI